MFGWFSFNDGCAITVSVSLLGLTLYLRRQYATYQGSGVPFRRLQVILVAGRVRASHVFKV